MLRGVLVGTITLLMSGCGFVQSTLNTKGTAANRIATMQWWMLILFCVVTVIVYVLFVVALRHRGTLEEHAPADTGGGQGWIIIGGLLVPLVVLTVIFIFGLNLMESFPIKNESHSDTKPSILVIGHQWWWEVWYLGFPSGPKFTTANEIHIPAGKPVTLELETADVLHSFWVPMLHGKVDMVPGHANYIRIEADHAGSYQGQCSLYCGKEHALMRLLVVADPPDIYQAWLTNQSRPGSTPTTSQAMQGEQLFLTGPCIQCHTVRGTSASGHIGPDLTHVGSRRMLASNVYPNNNGYLGGWIVHAQTLKPAALMPNLPVFTGQQLLDVVAYLRQLK